MEHKEIFERNTPEQQMLNSSYIIQFLELIEKYQVNLHSILLFRNNKMIFDGYYKPFNENTLHRMFSITKSFVSAGIGILNGKGLIDLDDHIIKYFPEYQGDDVDDFVKQATIKDLLQMKSPHEKTAFKQIDDDDYVKSFFKLKSTKVPGTVFSYDTSASHTLCALIEKISGKSLIDFLRDEFLTEAGFSKNAYCLKDPKGRSLGGSGLMAYPIDVAIFAHVFLNNGKIFDRQVIPLEYIKEATKKQADTFVKGANREEKQGYGYQFWRVSNNGYMCYGMAGQLAIILPKFNFVMVTTADTLEMQNGVQVIFDIFWETIYKGLLDICINYRKDDFNRLMKIKEKLEIKPIESFLENKDNFMSLISNKKNFAILENEYGLRNLEISILDSKEGNIAFDSPKGHFKIDFGIGRQVEGIFPYYKHRYIASGGFFSGNMLIIKCHVIGEEIGTIYIQIELKGYGDGISDSISGVMLTKKNVGCGFGEFSHTYFIN